MSILEARCTGCGETFNPHGESPDDLVHFAKANGDECGATGVITGEWIAPPSTAHPEMRVPKRFGFADDGFPFVSVGGSRWNGWYSPHVTRDVAERVIAHLNDPDVKGDRDVTYAFDGDDIVERWADDGSEYRHHPYPDGIYDVGFGLCWESDESGDCPHRNVQSDIYGDVVSDYCKDCATVIYHGPAR
jgi:hypothetical protein